MESHPAVRTVLEYLLAREGYAVEAFAAEEPFVAAPGPALLLVAAGDGGGLHVFSTEDVSETLAGFLPGTGRSPGAFSGAIGLQAFLPKPFGGEDVLRVIRMVGGFEGRKREHSGKA